MKNHTLFYEKPHVVLWKTTRCFMKNDTLFYENHTSFYDKRHVVLCKVSRLFSSDDRLVEKRKTHRLRYVFKIYIFAFVFRENFSIRSSVSARILVSTRLLLTSLFTTLRLTLSALLKTLSLFRKFDAHQREKKSKCIFEQKARKKEYSDEESE